MNEVNQIPATLFVHGRPCAHPCHAFFAQSINAQFEKEDHYLPWLDNPKSGHIKRYFSWFLNALFMPGTLRNKIYFAECIRFPLYFRRKWGLALRKKFIVLVDDETPYFLYSGQYSKRTAHYLVKFLSSCDGIITVGEMQKKYLQHVLPHFKGEIKVCYNPILGDRFQHLKQLKVNLASNQILIIANGPTALRMTYKGLDLMIKGFEKTLQYNPQCTLAIAGVWYPEIMKELSQSVPESVAERIHFLGEINDLYPHIEQSALCWHLSRGEAWGVSVTECMLAGLPVIVSDVTGSSEMLDDANQWMKIKCDSNELAATTANYFSLSAEEKKHMADLNQKKVQVLNEEGCKNIFIEKFRELI